MVRVKVRFRARNRGIAVRLFYFFISLVIKIIASLGERSQIADILKTFSFSTAIG